MLKKLNMHKNDKILCYIFFVENLCDIIKVLFLEEKN